MTINHECKYDCLDVCADACDIIHNGIVGQSPKLNDVLALMSRVAKCDIPVYLYGESGTGKELAARAIHQNSQRANSPFVPINCSSIPESLLEAELFGYVKGAFTGASHDHDGLFFQAHGGTLFLDEIVDMPLSMQVKLLRALQENTIRPLGSNCEIQTNVRIVTASNQDLKERVTQKQFREDLFFRLHGVEIYIPPLRERIEDLPLLIEYILQKVAFNNGGKVKTLSPEAYKLLGNYSWPGNIRELENAILNAYILSSGSVITVEDFAQHRGLSTNGQVSVIPKITNGQSLDAILSQLEYSILFDTLRQSDGNVSQAARTLKIPRPRLYRLIRKHHIPVKDLI